MHTIALHSLKGGSGKTSTAIHLAAALATPRRRVVVLDADPQHSALDWHEWSTAQNRPLSFDVRRLDASSEYLIGKRLDALGKRFPIVIIDLPPEIAETAEAAAGAVDLLLVPCTPSALDLRSAYAAIELGRSERERRGGKLPLIASVPVMLMARTRVAAELPGALAGYGEPVAPPIRRSVAVAQASVDGGVVRPSTPVGQDYARLARYVLKRLREAKR